MENVNDINEKLITNYQVMVEMFKEMIADRDKLIAVYEKQLLIQDRYINKVNENIEELKNIIL
jgi:site-specific DNA-adenine methylase